MEQANTMTGELHSVALEASAPSLVYLDSELKLQGLLSQNLLYNEILQYILLLDQHYRSPLAQCFECGF